MPGRFEFLADVAAVDGAHNRPFVRLYRFGHGGALVTMGDQQRVANANSNSGIAPLRGQSYDAGGAEREHLYGKGQQIAVRRYGYPVLCNRKVRYLRDSLQHRKRHSLQCTMDFRFHAFPDKGKGCVDPFLQVLRRETVRQFHFHGGVVGLAAVFRFCRELSKTGDLRRKRV